MSIAQSTQPTSRTPIPPFSPTTDWLTGDWGGVRSELKDVGIQLHVYYQQRYQQNFHGGLHTHHAQAFSGNENIQPDIDFEKMRLIKGGFFFLEAKGTWGTEIIQQKVGSIFDPNMSIGGNDPIYLNKFWYGQRLFDGKIELRAGILESKKNDLFDVNPYAWNEDFQFWNYLSLHTPSIPHKIGAGAVVRVLPTDWFYFQTAAIDADAKFHRACFDTAFRGRAFYIGYWETGLTPKWETARGPMPGKYYLGWWYDPRSKQIFEDDLDGYRAPELRSEDMGMYLGAAQMIYKEKPDPKDVQGLAVFSRAGFAHRDVNKVADSWQVGWSWTGLFPTRDADVTAFSVAQGILSNRYRVQVHLGADRETVYEFYHQFQMTPYFWISPDLQVITNPGGDKTGRDALVGGIRMRFSF